MVEVEIPIAPISKKIIETERGASPIRLRSHDLLYSFFQIKRVGAKRITPQFSNQLTAVLSIIVSPKLSKAIHANGDEIGRFLYRYHLDTMCKFVYAKWEGEAQINVKATIMAFYHRYNITEDDFSLETAYKRVQRYFWQNVEEKPTFCLKIKQQDVRLNSTVQKLKLKGLFFLNEQQVVDIHNDFFRAFYSESHNAPETYTDFFPNWLDYYYRGITVSEISKKKEITDKAIYQRISSFNNQLTYDADFRALVEVIIRKYIRNPTEKVLPIAL